MVDAWFADIDDRMAAKWPADKLAALKIRERIATLVETRIERSRPRIAAPRALAAGAAHQCAVRGEARLAQRRHDGRLAGDTATDYNHYSKRAILGAVYASTMAVFLNDESDGLPTPAPSSRAGSTR